MRPTWTMQIAVLFGYEINSKLILQRKEHK
jgi:hypothetical protein